MTTTKTRQTKKSLGLSNLKGVTVLNIPTGKRYAQRYRAEVTVNGTTLQRGTFATAQEAAEQANNFYKQIFGGIRAAKKAGYWNTNA
jgi:cyclopropane fatty-acyl-phospholipid synthase-like methyltransferase